MINYNEFWYMAENECWMYLEFADHRRAHAILFAGPLVLAVQVERDVAVGRLAGTGSASRMPNGRAL